MTAHAYVSWDHCDDCYGWFERSGSTAVDLAAFAPDRCPAGHDLRTGGGHRQVSFFPCECSGIRADPRHRRGHLEVACRTCCDAGVQVRFHDPVHVA